MSRLRMILAQIAGLFVFLLGFGFFAAVGFALVGFTILALGGVLIGKKLGLFGKGMTEEAMRARQEAAFAKFRTARERAHKGAERTKRTIIIEGEVVDPA